MAGIAALSALALTLSACGRDAVTTDDTDSTATGGQTASELSGAIAGAGASSQEKGQNAWVAEFMTKHPGLTVSYDPTGSGAGREQFINGTVVFAGSDAAFKSEEVAAATDRCYGSEPLELPLWVSPIAVVFNLEGVDTLNMSAETIAKVFAGQITNWNDPAIAELNSGVTLPDLAITPVHRSDNSGTTENFTATLAQVAPSVWTDAASGDWPASLAGEAAQGTSGVIAAVQNGSGTIGYADESGVPDGMSMALYSQDGSAAYTGPEADAAGAIVEASSRVAGREDNDWALDLDRTAAGYPFVLVSYAIVCQQYSDASVGELVNAYISYIVSDEGQEAAVPQAGNAPLSGTLATGVQAAAASIK